MIDGACIRRTEGPAAKHSPVMPMASRRHGGRRRLLTIDRGSEGLRENETRRSSDVQAALRPPDLLSALPMGQLHDLPTALYEFVDIRIAHASA